MEFVSSICGFWAQRAAHGLCALCLLTTPEISSTGPVRGRGFCPGSHRPRARVPLVVWTWDFLFFGFLPIQVLNQLEMLLRDSSVFCRTKGAAVTAAIVVIG
jgi:hypothetical protein